MTLRALGLRAPRFAATTDSSRTTVTESYAAAAFPLSRMRFAECCRRLRRFWMLHPAFVLTANTYGIARRPVTTRRRRPPRFEPNPIHSPARLLICLHDFPAGRFAADGANEIQTNRRHRAERYTASLSRPCSCCLRSIAVSRNGDRPTRSNGFDPQIEASRFHHPISP